MDTQTDTDLFLQKHSSSIGLEIRESGGAKQMNIYIHTHTHTHIHTYSRLTGALQTDECMCEVGKELMASPCHHMGERAG